MPDQLATSIAIVLATKGAEALAAGSRDAIAALYRTVSRRLRRRHEDAAVLDAAVTHPEQPSRQRELADVLGRTMAEDPAFADAMIARWRAAQGGVSVSGGGVLNQFSGRAEKVVQARDISGNIAL